MNRLPRAAANLAVAVSWLGAFALTACSGGTAAPTPPPPPPATPGDTFWLTPNGSEVVLKLSLIQPTVPF